MSRRVPVAVLVALAVVLAGCAGLPVAVPDDAPTTTDEARTADGTTTGLGPGERPLPPNASLTVHVLDVGQGASALVVGPTGETMLIDSGRWQDDGEDVLASLARLNVSRLDYLVTSHADADHVGGHGPVIDHLETAGGGVGVVYDPGIASGSLTYAEYLDAVEAHDVPLVRAEAGDAVPMAGANVTVLAPPPGYLAGEDRNENSVVLRVAYGGTSFLFTGDAGERGESYLVSTYGPALNVTVLQAGHHGSRSSTGGALLDAATPAAVVVSSAHDSPYGHPHNETLARLAARDVPTYWTATHGTVVFESDGDEVTVRAARAATTDPAHLRSAPPAPPGVAPSTVVGVVRDGRLSPVTPVPDGGTTTTAGAAGALRLVEVQADAPGSDAANPNGEFVVFENAGAGSLDLSGWTVSDAAGHTYAFPAGFSLGPGERVVLRSGPGTDAGDELFWDAGGPVWNNDGDTVVVRDAGGAVVLEVSYGGS